MKFTDGRKSIEITMKVWDKTNHGWKYDGEDLSSDFFGNNYICDDSNDEGKMVVEDVDVVAGYADDWEKCLGDYLYDEVADDEERIVTVDDLGVTAEDIASAIRREGKWNPDLCAALCKMAGLADEWEAANAESYEQVILAAAEKLDVEVY